MRKADNSIVVLQDGMVVCMGITHFILLTVGGGWMIYISFLPSPSDSAFSIWGLRIMMLACILALPILFVVNPERYFVWYRFTDEGIFFHTIFRRKKLLPYNTFPYVMHGKYRHGVYWRDYIVISNRRLTDAELNHINHVSPSSTLLKIRYSEKTCQKLLRILPQKQKTSVSSIKSSIEQGKRSAPSGHKNKHRKNTD